MAGKTTVQVTIAGKTLTLGGYESAEYLNKVAAYINDKIEDFKKLEGYASQSRDVKEILLELNNADDFFKAKKQIEELEEEVETKEQDLYNLKHELVSAQIKLDNCEKQIRELQKKHS